MVQLDREVGTRAHDRSPALLPNFTLEWFATGGRRPYLLRLLFVVSAGSLAGVVCSASAGKEDADQLPQRCLSRSSAQIPYCTKCSPTNRQDRSSFRLSGRSTAGIWTESTHCA